MGLAVVVRIDVFVRTGVVDAPRARFAARGKRKTKEVVRGSHSPGEGPGQMTGARSAG